MGTAISRRLAIWCSSKNNLPPAHLEKEAGGKLFWPRRFELEHPFAAASQRNAYANHAANRARIVPEVHVIGGQCNWAKLKTKSQALALALYHRVA